MFCWKVSGACLCDCAVCPLLTRLCCCVSGVVVSVSLFLYNNIDDIVSLCDLCASVISVFVSTGVRPCACVIVHQSRQVVRPVLLLSMTTLLCVTSLMRGLCCVSCVWLWGCAWFCESRPVCVLSVYVMGCRERGGVCDFVGLCDAGCVLAVGVGLCNCAWQGAKGGSLCLPSPSPNGCLTRRTHSVPWLRALEMGVGG